MQLPTTKNWIVSFLSFFMLVGISKLATAQQDTASIFNMSLEELMNVEIVSASKKSESLFDAPVASYTITHEEIINAGVTSIPEALRLCPGVIVREQTNGSYDVHIRGFDNPFKYTIEQLKGNNLSLVMIDNRPVFNYNNGGVYWEQLPIDINDIEQIEIIKGPAAALYGPNAVTGFVNIITKKIEKVGPYAVANVQSGNYGNIMANASVGHKPSQKFDFMVSGNFQQRHRYTADYYDIYQDKRIQDPMLITDYTPIGLKIMAPDPALVGGVNNTNPVYAELNPRFEPNPASISPERRAYFSNLYPDELLAMNKFGLNTFVHYQPAEKIDFRFSGGLQEATTQRPWFLAPTVLSSQRTQSVYGNVDASLYGVNARASWLNAHDDSHIGRPEMQYDYDIATVDLDYEWNLLENFSIQPALNYQFAQYTDKPYTVDQNKQGILNGQYEIWMLAASLRADYTFKEKLRLVAGLRIDQYNVPNKLFPSFQFAGTYKLLPSTLLRVNYARAYSGSFVALNFSEYTAVNPLPPAHPLYGAGIRNLGIAYRGLKGGEPVRMDMAEVGIRVKITDKIQADISGFYQVATNFKNFISQPQEFTVEGQDPSLPLPVYGTMLVPQQIEVLPLEVKQMGVTYSVNAVVGHNFQFKPFLTMQLTRLVNFTPYNQSPNNYDLIDGNNAFTTNYTQTTQNNATPTVFGGAYVNYQPNKKLNINITGYYLGAQTQHHLADVVPQQYNATMAGVANLSGQGNSAFLNRNSTEGHIQPKVLLNAKVAYKITPQLGLFVTGRNLLHNTEREYYGADIIGTTVLGGVNFAL